MTTAPVLAAKNIVKHFPVRKGIFSKSNKFVRAVDGVSLEIYERENLALVGESGCGKTTLGRILCRLIEPTAGTIEYMGSPVGEWKHREFASGVQPIFQDPYSALNPRKKIRKILSKPFEIHGIRFGEDRLIELLTQVGLVPGKAFLDRHPHELSGGQRQRVVIARALALKPRLLVADEPVSGLDATVQTQILNLMRSLQNVYKTTFLVISHDITLVKTMCQRTAVMYLGKLVELGPTQTVVQNPLHPYTVSLLRSFPSGDPEKREWVDTPPIAGDVPSAIDPPSGCRFRTRCPAAKDRCALEEPVLVPCRAEHLVACSGAAS